MTRFRSKSLAALFIVASASAAAFAQSKAAVPAPVPAPAPPAPFAMSPGLWEIVVANETPGVDMKRSTTSLICFKKDDIRSTQQALPQQHDFGSKCTIKDYKLANDVATWGLSCNTKTGGNLSGPGTITYKAAEYAGTAALVSKEGGKTKKVNQTFTAKRLSDCK